MRGVTEIPPAAGTEQNFICYIFTWDKVEKLMKFWQILYNTKALLAKDLYRTGSESENRTSLQSIINLTGKMQNIHRLIYFIYYIIFPSEEGQIWVWALILQDSGYVLLEFC